MKEMTENEVRSGVHPVSSAQPRFLFQVSLELELAPSHMRVALLSRASGMRAGI